MAKGEMQWYRKFTVAFVSVLRYTFIFMYLSMHPCACHLCRGAPQRPKDCIRTTRAEVTDDCDILYMGIELTRSSARAASTLM